MSAPHHGPDGRFRNPWPGEGPPGFATLRRWAVERRRQPPPADPPPGALPLATPAFVAPRAPADIVSATWIGHATVLLQLGGVNVLTDPMFGRRASPVSFAGPARRVPPGVPLDALPPLDLIVLSHNHYDHFDAPSVRALIRRDPGTPWVAPLRLGTALRALGAAHVTELDWWEAAGVGGVAVTAVPARHFSSRTPFDRGKTLWCGFALRVGARAAFFAGDTAHHPAFGEIGARLGPFDLSLLPIGAYDPRWVMRGVHMDPEEAVRAFQELGGPARAGALVPVHWGTFKLTDEPMDEPPRVLREAWRRAALAESALRVLRHGETAMMGSGESGAGSGE